MLNQVLAGWREAGYGRDALELCAVGDSISESSVEWFAGESDASCFADGLDQQNSAFRAFNAEKGDLFVIDKAGTPRYWGDLDQKPLSNAANRADLDSLVRGLL